MGEEQSAEVGEPAEYDSGVVFGKGEVAPDVEEDVQDVSFTFAVELTPPCGVPSSRTCTKQKLPCCARALSWSVLA